VVSPKGGCGKTTISLNLALSLARQGRRVVLLDTDANGDVLSAIDAGARAKFGFYDLLSGQGSLQQALLPTVLPGFKILPAVGQALPDPDQLTADLGRLRRLFSELAYEAEIVIVDTPAGMFGVTQPIARVSTHVLGVLQAEQIAGRSFRRFAQALDAIPPAERPAVLGVVINMLQAKHEASLSVLQAASQDFPAEWLFDTSIPRHQAFLDASFAGVPLRHLNESAPPAVAWLFDTLAAEIAERLRLPEIVAPPQPLLL
jgi:chromosome partitioning protein